MKACSSENLQKKGVYFYFQDYQKSKRNILIMVQITAEGNNYQQYKCCKSIYLQGFMQQQWSSQQPEFLAAGSSGNPSNGIPAKFYGFFRFRWNQATEFPNAREIPVNTEFCEIIFPPELFFDGIIYTLFRAQNYKTAQIGFLRP